MSSQSNQKEKLLEMKNVTTSFDTDDGKVTAIEDISFDLYKGESLGILGESGCGKSVTSLSIMRLLPQDVGYVENGEIIFQGENLLDIKEEKMRSYRGNKISMIFQEPMTSLNPVFKVKKQLVEVYTTHQDVNSQEAYNKALDILDLVGIPDQESVIEKYPYQLSGGMRQRVMIAMALACQPALLIADEPTTALDVTIQAQILKLMKELKQEINSSIMLITHDLGVIAQMVERVLVYYAGQIVERAQIDDLYENPKHPYTKGLIKSIPKIGKKINRLDTIQGMVPSPFEFPQGCRFNPRCEHAMDICKEKEPPEVDVGDRHTAKCWLHVDEGESK
ncbi:MAG TPA: ABC transporter ATP-binding protein [Halanaerobiales bacterium]|nr:ABC transporter ATP-binding protein [Halanaerobiales bacterium]